MQNANKISTGLINFTNCLPINYTLEKWALEKLVISRGHPSLINQLLLDSQVQAAPISSIEYLLNEDKYILIKEACITSDAECGSVILFSGFRFEQLRGKKIAFPFNSAASVVMLKILLAENGISSENTQFLTHYYKKPVHEYLKKEFDAVLYIGDEALVAGINYRNNTKMQPENNLKKEWVQKNVLISNQYPNEIIQYDIGKLWREFTGLPPVFGTWAARADWVQKNEEDFEWLKFIITKALEAGSSLYFNDIISTAAKNLNIHQDYVKDYLTAKIKYGFTKEHEKSLDLFKKLYFSTKNCHSY